MDQCQVIFENGLSPSCVCVCVCVCVCGGGGDLPESHALSGPHPESGGSITLTVALLASLSSSCSGYGNVAPKTPAGRLFCVFYGLFGVPLCLTWISALGKFFGGRAKRLGQFLTKRGVSLVCPHPWVLGRDGEDPGK